MFLSVGLSFLGISLFYGKNEELLLKELSFCSSSPESNGRGIGVNEAVEMRTWDVFCA